MNLLPKSKTDFSEVDYWNSFFKHRKNKAFEWYGEYHELCSFIHKYIRPKDQVLVVGCGNSKLSADLYDVGYRNLINIDISKVVIKQMKAANSSRPELIFEEMDALNTTYNNEQFSVVLDKGTLDALMPDSEDTTKENISKYFDEIDRVLRVGGRYVFISLLQDHVLSYTLEVFLQKGWMVRIHRCIDAEEQSRNREATMILPVFVVICTKFKNNSLVVIEMDLTNNGTIQKVDSKEKVTTAIKELQKMAMVCGGLKKIYSPGQEIVINVCEPSTGNIKYNVVVADKKSSVRPVKFAAYIVPPGRESEYIHSMPEGRQDLMESLTMDRLAVISIKGNDEPVSFQKVKEDLTPLICDVALNDCRKPIPFLSTSSDDDQGKEISRGNTNFNGEYVIRDIEQNGITLRKLIFLSNISVTQSEARLKKVKGSKKKRLVVDVGYLSCYHHVLISVGACTVLDWCTPGNVLVLGLGGGGLCGYLHKCLTSANIVAVDIDPAMVKIATEYFHLVPDDRMDLQVSDGIEYMVDSLATGKQFDVIIFDVDNKDLSMGMSCPPKHFLSDSVLSNVSSLLTEQGIFLLNLVCRNKDLRKEAYERIKKEFSRPYSIRVPDELGEVILCWKNSPENAMEAFDKGVDRLTSIIHVNKFDPISTLTRVNKHLQKL